jgi:hypothetical protein
MMNYYSAPQTEHDRPSGHERARRLTKRERNATTGRGVGLLPMAPKGDQWGRIPHGVCTNPHRGPNRLPKHGKLKGWQRQAREARR